MKDPTPEEIAARCAEIQATWDEATRESRIADPTRRPDYVCHWEVPVVSIEELGGEAECALQSVVDIGDVMETADPLIPYPLPAFPDADKHVYLDANQDRVKKL